MGGVSSQTSASQLFLSSNRKVARYRQYLGYDIIMESDG